ncbi:MAG TPA: helix-turn-helix domain-containing protein [Fimbriimonadaceae bacterium]|nr:helix-turn-helix domain-containing protein [Fimbriimonadaceae bacterium]HRJ95588.1 helix-turn-helix domain-containing protein [Fimbriimonadaceae bacterium]
MPTIDDYAPYAPFTIEELVRALNSIFRDRRRLHVQARTVRYYISKGLLPPPSGGPKFARYSLEHLKRLVAIRTWLDEGISLEEAMVRLGGQPLPNAPVAKRSPVLRVEEPKAYYGNDRVVRRIQLSPTCVLEVDASADLREQIRAILPILEKMVPS